MFQHIFPVNIFRHVTRAERRRGGGEGEISPAFFQKLEKGAQICRKICPDCGHLQVKFLI